MSVSVFGPLCENITPSVKPEIHNVLRCYQWRTEPRPRRACKENFVKFGHVVFGRPFVKRFTLCYRTVALSVCLSVTVTLVYCGQTVGWIKVKLGVQVGLVPGHAVLDGDPAPPPKKKVHSPQFSAHVYCGQI